MPRLPVAALLFAVSALAEGEGLLDFHDDFAFPASRVEAVAAHAYRNRLLSLDAAGDLDVDGALVARLRMLLARVEVAARLERPATAAHGWEIHACRRCGENAGAMAGGKLLVGEEFIAALAPTDDELGYLLAHEMAHVLAEHSREFASVARYFVDNGRNREYEDIQRELDESFVTNLRMDVVQRQQEFEADFIGFILGAESGFDPAAMPALLWKLPRATAAALSSHPQGDERWWRAQRTLSLAQRIHAQRMPAARE